MQDDPTRGAAALLLRRLDDPETPAGQKVRAAATLVALAEGVIKCEGAWYAMRLDAETWLTRGRRELAEAVEAAQLQAWLYRNTLTSGHPLRSEAAALKLLRLAEEWLGLDERTLRRLPVDTFRAWRDDAIAAQAEQVGELRGVAA